jgi:hypothetical protein
MCELLTIFVMEWHIVTTLYSLQSNIVLIYLIVLGAIHCNITMSCNVVMLQRIKRGGQEFRGGCNDYNLYIIVVNVV